MEALVRYRKVASFDDELTIRTGLAQMSRVSLRFEYTVLREGDVLVTGHTRHACVELATGRPSRIPERLRAVVRDTC